MGRVTKFIRENLPLELFALVVGLVVSSGATIAKVTAAHPFAMILFAVVFFFAGALAYEKAEHVDELRDKVKELDAKLLGMTAAMDVERDEDADRFIKLPFAAYAPLDSIIEADAAGKRFYTNEVSDELYYLRRKKIIEGDFGKYGFCLAMKYRPFFERYADAIHEIAQGTNDDRLRIAEEVRKGRHKGGR